MKDNSVEIEECVIEVSCYGKSQNQYQISQRVHSANVQKLERPNTA